MGTELRIYSKEADFWGVGDAYRYEDAIRDAIEVVCQNRNDAALILHKLYSLIDKAEQIADEAIEADYQEHIRREAEESQLTGDEIPF